MTFFENEYLWWTKVAAVGQCVAAFATFCAVALSLKLSLREHFPTIKVQAELQEEHGDYFLVMKAVNDGKVPIALKKKFHLISPDKNSQTIDPMEIRHCPEVLATGDYWEITFDLNYLIKRLESQDLDRTDFPKFTVAFEDHIGRQYPSRKLPQLPKEF